MAKKTLVQLVDDLTGESISDDSGRTVRFAFDGAEYEIDLSHAHVEEFQTAVDPYVRASRRVAGRRKSSSGSSRGAAGQTAEIREWAESQGLQVASRGRISADIVERFNNR